MNQIKKSSTDPLSKEEDVEVVEGEIIGTETALEKHGRSALVSRGTVEVAAVIGSAALGLLKIFKIFSGFRSSGKTPAGLRRRRRRK